MKTFEIHYTYPEEETGLVYVDEVKAKDSVQAIEKFTDNLEEFNPKIIKIEEL